MIELKTISQENISDYCNLNHKEGYVCGINNQKACQQCIAKAQRDADQKILNPIVEALEMCKSLLETNKIVGLKQSYLDIVNKALEVK